MIYFRLGFIYAAGVSPQLHKPPRNSNSSTPSSVHPTLLGNSVPAWDLETWVNPISTIHIKPLKAAVQESLHLSATSKLQSN
jgi:hypothetical protein